MKKTRTGLTKDATLAQLQRHVDRTAKERGFVGQNAPQKCLILGEEVGELFKAVRKTESIPIDRNSKVSSVSEELADVLMYVCSIANYFKVDLEKAFRDKDKVNSRRVWRKSR